MALFHSTYCKLVDKYIFSVTFEVKDSPQWMNKLVRNKINIQRKAWIKYKRTLHTSDYLNNTQHRNNCTAAVRKIKHDFESNLVNGIKVDPKRS